MSFTFKTIMENKQALLLLEKNLKDLNKKKFSVESIVTDLKKIREITLDLQNPVVTKSLRLAYEHLEIKNAFLIAIPADEPVWFHRQSGPKHYDQRRGGRAACIPMGTDVAAPAERAAT